MRPNHLELIVMRPEGVTAIDFIQEAAEYGLKYLQDIEALAHDQWYLWWCYVGSPGEIDDNTARWWNAVERLAARRCYRMISDGWFAKQHANAAAPKRYLFGSPVVP